MKGARFDPFLILSIILVAIAFSVWELARARREHAYLISRAPAAWRQARIGMSTQEIETLLGEPPVRRLGTPPTRVKTPLGLTVTSWAPEVWYYRFGLTNTDGRYTISFTNGTVFQIEVQ
jgi:hypothetical protein